ncbi:MAG: metalloregulator ArsR/SmtB family transcription factor [Gluconobacter potus]|uniref:Winged helix-turn-helix transcriptional regulator n=1 Tax=Gluconobacter potus TaxID=2724927 RepID=A0ABR9YI72_9PROT|nr:MULTISPECIES: metalloregulator ArsR/SmtB family transcription factor [Gluconobacter]MBF0863544.1 winged helix-turn-helix transcriptional regulator [Gluconobacter sp. R71656]MBF0866351.1 winged helix-turn-helix transcriptional regulator [Gluconobacter sp. R75628]MBF0872521.1 winged helix-turn-helix transcriptional regulator [Gluconobacter sp. R75629]MBF0881487.1 winged helix-turn-helix transcriptional regulator [Gluconobacter potus]
MTVLLPLEKSRELAEWLRILAQPQRLMILSALLDSTHAVSEIETMTGIGQPTLSQHLGALRRAGLIESQRESRAIHYCWTDTPDARRARALLMSLQPGALPPELPSPAPETTPGPAASARFARILHP